MPRVLNSPSTAAPTAMQPPRAGHPGGRRGAMGADRARGRSRGRNASKGLRCHCRTASHTASVIFGDRSRAQVHTDRGRQVVADIAHRHARAYKLMIIESRPPGSALSLAHQARGERARPAPWGPRSRRGPPPNQRSWPHSRSSCWDAPTEPTRPSRSPGDRSAQRPARVPGPLFEQSGEQAIGPSDHRPRPNRSARTSRPTPQRNATAPPHPRPPTRAITSSVITYRSFQIKGIHRQLNTPHAHDRGRCPSGRERPRTATHPCCTQSAPRVPPDPASDNRRAPTKHPGDARLTQHPIDSNPALIAARFHAPNGRRQPTTTPPGRLLTPNHTTAYYKFEKHESSYSTP